MKVYVCLPGFLSGCPCSIHLANTIVFPKCFPLVQTNSWAGKPPNKKTYISCKRIAILSCIPLLHAGYYHKPRQCQQF